LGDEMIEVTGLIIFLLVIGVGSLIFFISQEGRE